MLTNKSLLTKRSYSFGEIAQLLFPNISPKSAANRLRRWIDDSPVVRTALADTGIKPRQKLLSPKQVAVLTEYFGDFNIEE